MGVAPGGARARRFGWRLCGSSHRAGSAHGVRAPQGGGLYVAKRCARHDKRLTWNITGPRGATGQQGSTGNPGPLGPSDAYYATAPGGTGTGYQTVSLAVPPGDYTATAEAEDSASGYAHPILAQSTLGADDSGAHPCVGSTTSYAVTTSTPSNMAITATQVGAEHG